MLPWRTTAATQVTQPQHAGHVVFTWKKAGADFYLSLDRIFDRLFYFSKFIIRAVFQSSCYPVRCFIADRKKSHAAV